MIWNRKLWAVELTDSHGRKELLYTSWDDSRRAYKGEPIRMLVFETRKDARAWCKKQELSYAQRPTYDICRQWRFRPVRVRAVVKKI